MKIYFFWIALGIYANIHHGSTQNSTEITELVTTATASETDSPSSTLETTEENTTTPVFSTTIPPTLPETTASDSTASVTDETTPPPETVPSDASTTQMLEFTTDTTEIDTTTTVSTTTMSTTSPGTTEVIPSTTPPPSLDTTAPTTTVTTKTIPPSTDSTSTISIPNLSTETMTTPAPDTTASTSTTALFSEITTTSLAPNTSEYTSAATPSTSEESNTTDTETTSSTVTSVQSTTPNICAPCINGECESVGNYECVCHDGWYGANCDMSSVCEERSDFETLATDCNETSPEQNITMNFAQTEAGKSASSNTTCTTCSGDTVSVARYECAIAENGNAEWVGYSTIDCSEGFEDKSTDDKAQFLAVTTSDTSETTSQDVENAVEGLGTITSNSSDLSHSTANDIVTTVNNLLLVENGDAKTEVETSANSLLGAIDSITENVVLEDGSYSYVQSNIAVAVVENAALRWSRDAGDNFYYGTNNTLGESYSNLALISPSLSRSEPFGSYMKASLLTERTSFKMYLMSDAFLHGDTSIVVESVVFSVQGNGEFTLNFQTTRHLDISPDGSLVGDATRRLDCAFWNRSESAWEDGGCTNYEATESFSSCVCSKEGEYIMRTVVVERPTGDDGLDAGAIVGIVLGSICGVILVFGIFYYFSKKRKQNKGDDYLGEVEMSTVNKEVKEPSLNEATNDAYEEDASEKSSLNASKNEDSKEEKNENEISTKI